MDRQLSHSVIKYAAVGIVVMLTAFSVSHAEDQQLFETLANLDQRLFGYFNTCQLEKQKALLAEDIEFYHDKGGLTVSRLELLKSSYERCANTATKLRRELIKGSLEVYPVKGYGAIQKGTHRFYLTEAAQQEVLVEIAQFTHVWQQSDDGWKITRVLSYDHKPPE